MSPTIAPSSYRSSSGLTGVLSTGPLMLSPKASLISSDRAECENLPLEGHRNDRPRGGLFPQTGPSLFRRPSLEIE